MKTLQRRQILILALIISVAACVSATAQEGRTTLPRPQDRFRAPDSLDAVQTLLFAYIPPDYVTDNVERFSEMGVSGFMMGDIMYTWDSDIWAQPGGWFTPSRAPVVGNQNRLFASCRRMNEVCRQYGITENSIKVAYRNHLPDWFDEIGWMVARLRMRQCAIFAHDAGFAGVTFDYEYIREQYRLDWPAYIEAGYDSDSLRVMARQRGYEIMSTMLAEFPGMKTWIMPESTHGQGPLIAEYILGMLAAAAERDAPGGMHLSIEGTYQMTDPQEIIHFTHFQDYIVRSISRHDEASAQFSLPPGALLDYWQRRGTVAPGLWPLGYMREIRDAEGNVLGYSGRESVFGNRVVGSYQDKGPNYSVDDFRRQYAAARSISRKYVWIYCHGSVFWQLTPQEHARLRGKESDVLPMADNVAEYEAVLRERQEFDDPAFRRTTDLMRTGQFDITGWGYPDRWWTLKPFPTPDSAIAADVLRQDESISDVLNEVHTTSTGDTLFWEPYDVTPSRYVNLAGWLDQDTRAFGYAVAEIDAPEATSAWLRFGSNGLDRVWINGRLVHEIRGERWPKEDRDRVRINLAAGRNTVVVKSGAERILWDFFTWWGFYLRITDVDGNEIPGPRWTEPAFLNDRPDVRQ